MRDEEPCHLCGKPRQSYVEMEVRGVRKSICERCYKTKVAVPREPVEGEDDGEATSSELRFKALQTIPPTPATRRNEAAYRAEAGGADAGGPVSAQDASSAHEASDGTAPTRARRTACGSCGTELAVDDSFCHSCGEPVAKPRFCGKCGRKASTGDRFCPGCGAEH